jgi:hypothetical protein
MLAGNSGGYQHPNQSQFQSSFAFVIFSKKTCKNFVELALFCSQPFGTLTISVCCNCHW